MRTRHALLTLDARQLAGVHGAGIPGGIAMAVGLSAGIIIPTLMIAWNDHKQFQALRDANR